MKDVSIELVIWGTDIGYCTDLLIKEKKNRTYKMNPI